MNALAWIKPLIAAQGLGRSDDFGLDGFRFGGGHVSRLILGFGHGER